MNLHQIKSNFDQNPAHVSDRELLEIYKCCGSPLIRHQAVVPRDQARAMAAKIKDILHKRSQGTAENFTYVAPENRLPKGVVASEPSPQVAIDPFAVN